MDCLLWVFFVVVGLRHGNIFAGLFVFTMGAICVVFVFCFVWIVLFALCDLACLYLMSGCVLAQALWCVDYFDLFSAQFAECLSNMLLANGVLVSVVCRDQFAITAEVTGCSSELQGASCCAVFASDVAAFFLRGATGCQ